MEFIPEEVRDNFQTLIGGMHERKSKYYEIRQYQLPRSVLKSQEARKKVANCDNSKDLNCKSHGKWPEKPRPCFFAKDKDREGPSSIVFDMTVITDFLTNSCEEEFREGSRRALAKYLSDKLVDKIELLKQEKHEKKSLDQEEEKKEDKEVI